MRCTRDLTDEQWKTLDPNPEAQEDDLMAEDALGKAADPS
jgi:hypothetical protein